MKQEDKELLLKDLSARLPYRVKILHEGWSYDLDDELSTVERVVGIDENFIYTKVIDTHNGEEYRNEKRPIDIFNDKPYLFPLSSMTEEQKKELKNEVCPDGTGYFNEESLICPATHIGDRIPFKFMSKIIDWLNKNHFDIYGFIPMGLAIDATGLNIY